MSLKNYFAGLHVAAFAVAASVAGVPSAAVAASNVKDCSCSVGSTGLDPVGTIGVASGLVYRAGASGHEVVGVDAKIFRDDVLQTGPDATALLLIGAGCQVEMGASSTASFTGSCLHVRSQEVAVLSVHNTVPGNGFSPPPGPPGVPLPVIIGGAVVGGAAISVAIAIANESVSRR